MSYRIAGYASIFNVVDSHNDLILPGAYKKTLAAARRYNHVFPIFAEHDEKRIIGKVVKIRENSKGLWIEAVIFDQHEGARLKNLFNEGIQLGFSIGYNTMKATWENDDPKNYHDLYDETRKIIEVHLYEISVVKWPSNSHCVVSSIVADKPVN